MFTVMELERQSNAADSGSNSVASKTGFCCIFHDFFLKVALLEGSVGFRTGSERAFVNSDGNSSFLTGQGY